MFFIFTYKMNDSSKIIEVIINGPQNEFEAFLLFCLGISFEFTFCGLIFLSFLV